MISTASFHQGGFCFSPHIFLVPPLFFFLSFFQTAFFVLSWFMHWLIHHNHKLGKMFSAPSHAVKTGSCDLGPRGPACHCEGRKRFQLDPVRFDTGQWRIRRPWRKWKDSPRFSEVYFPARRRVEGSRFRSNVADQTSFEQTHTHWHSHSIILSIGHEVISSLSCAHVSKNTQTHGLVRASSARTPNKQWPESSGLS